MFLFSRFCQSPKCDAWNLTRKLQSIIQIFSDLKENAPKENQKVHEKIDKSMKKIYISMKRAQTLGSEEKNDLLDDQDVDDEEADSEQHHSPQVTAG